MKLGVEFYKRNMFEIGINLYKEDYSPFTLCVAFVFWVVYIEIGKQ